VGSKATIEYKISYQQRVVKLPSNIKARKELGRFAPGGRDLFNFRGRWTLAKQNEEPFKGRASSLGDHFNAAVARIAYKSTQAEVESFVDNELAEADALHKAGHPGK
jgi:hypothetical protein